MGPRHCRGACSGRPGSARVRRQGERVARQRERPAPAGGALATGAGRPMFPVTVNSVDGICRERTVAGLTRQRGLALDRPGCDRHAHRRARSPLL